MIYRMTCYCKYCINQMNEEGEREVEGEREGEGWSLDEIWVALALLALKNSS